MGAALKFRQTDVPRQAAEMARLKVVHGPDQGSVFVISGVRATIGRGEDCDVVIADLKASRQHAELSFVNNQWAVRDLGSANGIAHNGRMTRSAVIRTTDTVTVGETTLEFVTADAGTMLLRAIPRNLGEVEADQGALQAQRERVRQLAQFGATKPIQAMPAAGGDPNSRKVLLFAAAGIVAFVLLTTSDKPALVKKKVADKNLAQFLPQDDETMNKSAEPFLRAGFREYRSRNYLRARTQFETVLQISPTNSLARLYLENCEQSIKDEVAFHLERGQRSFNGGNYKQAKIQYEAIERLLFRDQSNPAFIEARDRLVAVKKEMED